MQSSSNLYIQNFPFEDTRTRFDLSKGIAIPYQAPLSTIRPSDVKPFQKTVSQLSHPREICYRSLD